MLGLVIVTGNNLLTAKDNIHTDDAPGGPWGETPGSMETKNKIKDSVT